MQICLVIRNGTRISYFEKIRNLISYLGYQAGLYRFQQSITKGNIQILKNWVSMLFGFESQFCPWAGYSSSLCPQQ